MNREQAERMVDEATSLINRARERMEEYGDQPVPADQQEKIDGWLAQATEMKARADAGIVDLNRQRKVEEFQEWSDRVRAQVGEGAQIEPPLPGMTSGGGTGGGGNTIEVKTAKGRLETRRVSSHDDVEHVAIFRRYLARGPKGLLPQELDLIEKKSLSAGLDVEGGFLVPEVFRAELIEAIEDMTFMRRVARVLPPIANASAIRVPTAADLDDATWTSELATGNTDTAQPFGSRMLQPHPLAKEVKVSNTLLRLASVDVEAWVRGELANRFSAAEENAYMNGTGAQQPQGVFNSPLITPYALANATTLTGDDFVNTEFQLKAQYRSGASWILHRTVLNVVALLKNGDGQYIWRPSFTAGVPSTLVGYPVNESEYAPSTLTSGLNIAALGNWGRSYWIVDSLNLQVQRLVELYARSNEVGFIGRKETDGMVVDPNGIVIARMAT